MDGITNPKIEAYLDSLREEPDAVRAEMERLAERRGFPIVGPEVGRLLALLTRISGARRILELGSGFGYSAWWFAGALSEGGTVICTDSSAEHRELALEFLERAGLANRIRFEVGDSLEILESLEGHFDLVFNDIDKEDYPRSLDQVVPRLAPGGLFVTDNTLWYSKVTDPAAGDATTRAVHEFNRLSIGHPELETVILPIRDGLSVSRKRRRTTG
jgi:predicted O-methyltransferase YrrM